MTRNPAPGYKKYPEHRIETKPAAVRVRVTVNGEVIADTRDAIRMEEGDYPAVFYFPRKEDVLFEVGVLSTQSAQRTVRALLSRPYEITAVIDAALATLERSMTRNPPDLIIETILEGYRHEHRILAGEQPADPDLGMFTELFEKAQHDRKLPERVDVD